MTVPCTRCGKNSVPTPKSVEEDPICEACRRDLYPPTCPGYALGPGEECGNATLQGSDLCGDCHLARCDTESPRIPH